MNICRSLYNIFVIISYMYICITLYYIGQKSWDRNGETRACTIRKIITWD